MSNPDWSQYWGKSLGEVSAQVTEETINNATLVYRDYHLKKVVPVTRAARLQRRIQLAMLAVHWLEMQRKPELLAKLYADYNVKEREGAELSAFVRAMNRATSNDVPTEHEKQDVDTVVRVLKSLIVAVQTADMIAFGYADTAKFVDYQRDHTDGAIAAEARKVTDIIRKRRERREAAEAKAAVKANDINNKEDFDRDSAGEPTRSTDGVEEQQTLLDPFTPEVGNHPKNDDMVIYPLKTHETLRERLADERNRRFVIAMEDGDIMLCEKDRDGRTIVVDWDAFDADGFQQLIKDFFMFFDPKKHVQ